MTSSNLTFYYLNLDRRTDRREHMEQQFAKVGIDATYIIRMQAHDATHEPVPDHVLKLFQKADFADSGILEHKIAANCWGHMKMWQAIIDRELPCAVLMQDDAVLANNFLPTLQRILDNLPEDAEVVWLALPWQVSRRRLNNPRASDVINYPWANGIVNDYIAHLHPKLSNPGSLAYIMTLEGAKCLLEHTYKQGVLRATDGHMVDYLAEKNKNWASRPLIASYDPRFGTDIFN